MDADTKKVFDEILAKDESSLTEDDIAFLRARESYLSYDDKVRLKKFLQIKDENTFSNLPEGLAEALKKKTKDLSEEEVELIKANADKLDEKAVKKFKEILN